MATSAGPVIFIAMLALTACDLSEKKPETIKAALPDGAAGDAQALPGPLGSAALAPGHASASSPAAAAGSAPGTETARGERSIRLYGPGVSRKRQIRV